MKTIIIALLFRVTTGKKTLLEKLEYITFAVNNLLSNPDFQDTASQALLNQLDAANDAAAAAAAKAESKATLDIKAKNLAAKKLDKAYAKVALHAEDICDGNIEKAIATNLTMRKKGTKKTAKQPQNVRATGGKQLGEIEAKCKSQGSGITYLWYIRKESEATYSKPEATTKASITFTGLQSGINYVAYVAAKSADELSEASDIVICRAK